VKPLDQIETEQVELKHDHFHGHRVRAALVPFYRSIANNFPFLVPIYRNIAHREVHPPFRRKFAVGELHQAIKREFGHRRGGVFLEAGANDGLLFSNTAYLERYCGWRGVLVEAVPHKFVECVRNRPGSIVEHCALVAEDFGEPYVEMRYSNLMSYAPLLTNINQQEQIAQGSEFLLEKERRVSGQLFLAPARTLKNTLSMHNVRHIDFMVLDLEGAELEALRGLDFNICPVDSILIEVRELQAVDEFLTARGFRREAQFSDRDYFYRRA
jgi:FkbM family methyltransferase